MDISTLLGAIGSLGDGLDNFAHANNIKLSLIVILLLVEMLQSLVWMMAIKRGFSMGLNLWFVCTFILVLIICVYAVLSVTATSAASSGIWFVDSLKGVLHL
jgi:hypothetical protein